MTALPSEVSLPTETCVEVRRRFAAPREQVYRAYTAAERFQRWCGGMPGWSMPICELDARVGGAYRWQWRADEGGVQFGFQGEFLAVEPPARLVHTQRYDAGDLGVNMASCTVTVELSEAEGVTTVVTRIEYESREARDLSFSSGMTEGMELNYQRLDELLARGPAE